MTASDNSASKVSRATTVFVCAQRDVSSSREVRLASGRFRENIRRGVLLTRTDGFRLGFKRGGKKAIDVFGCVLRYPVVMELIFEIRDAAEGGFCARALGHAIVTEPDTWDELRSNV